MKKSFLIIGALFYCSCYAYSQKLDYVTDLKSKSISINSLDSAGSIEELIPVANTLWKHKIIGIGEATHGTSEFVQAKLKIIKTLAINNRLRAIALEVGVNNCDAINDYVLNDKGDIQSVLQSLQYWSFNSVEFGNFVEWIKNYNQTLNDGDRLRFYGFDCQYRGNTDLKIKSYLTSSQEIQSTDSLIRVINNSVINRKPIDTIRRKIELISSLVRQSAIKRGDVTSKELKMANNSIRYLDQFLTFRSMPPEKVNTRDGFFRDSCMADNLKWIIDNELEKDEHIVVFSHNTHIRNNDVPKNNMGFFLKSYYKEKYYALGMVAKQGTFISVKDRTFESFPLISDKNGLECILSEAGLSISFLNLEELDNVPSIVSVLGKNLRYNSNGGYVKKTRGVINGDTFGKGNILNVFDGIFYIEESHPISIRNEKKPNNK